VDTPFFLILVEKEENGEGREEAYGWLRHIVPWAADGVAVRRKRRVEKSGRDDGRCLLTLMVQKFAVAANCHTRVSRVERKLGTKSSTKL